MHAAFSVEPRTVVATLLAVDGELAVGHAGLRRLQTGDRQPAAIGLYESIGYRLIPPYAPFHLMDNALCYEKVLAPVRSIPPQQAGCGGWAVEYDILPLSARDVRVRR